MRRAIAVFLAACLCWAGLVAGAEAKRVALIIGNSGYVHASRLPNPANDARDIARSFQALGFEVSLVEDTTRAQLLDALRSFRAQSLGAEQSVIYYAGHGIEMDRQNFVVPVDAELKADIDVEYEAVPLELLVAATSGAKGLQLVVLDACRDNPFLTQMTRTLTTRSIGRGLALYEPDGNSLVAYAAREGTVALDGTGSNSPYAKAFLTALEEPGLEIGQFFRKVRDAVVRDTNGQQEPFLYGSLSAEPVFFRPQQPQAVAAAVPQPVAPAPAPGSAASTDTLLAIDIAFWQSIRDSRERSDFEDYLSRFPNGQFRPLAQRRLAALRPVEKPARSTAVAPGATVVPPAPSAAARAAVPAPSPQAAPAPSAQTATPAPSLVVVPTPLRLSRDETRDLQARLNILGFSAGVEDGIAGRRTMAAVAAYRAARGMAGPDQIDTLMLARIGADVPEARLIAYREERRKPSPTVTARKAQPQSSGSPAPRTTAKRQPAAKKKPAASSGNLAGFVGKTYCRSKGGVVLNGRNLSDRPIWCITVLALSNSGIRYRVSQRQQAGKPLATSVLSQSRSGNRVYGPVKLASSGSGSLVANGGTFVASRMYR